MAIVNRDKDGSEQRLIYENSFYSDPSGISAGILNPGVPTGKTYPICTIPYPSTLDAANVAAWGISGTPVYSLWIYRFAGGFTSIVCGQTLTMTAFGTSGSLSGNGVSGALGFSLIAANASTFPLIAGDQVALYTQGANSAFATVTVSLVIRATQDIRSNFGV